MKKKESITFSHTVTGTNRIIYVPRPKNIAKQDGAITFDDKPMKYDKISDTFFLE